MEKPTANGNSTNSPDVPPDSDSVWSYEVIDEDYVERHGLDAPKETHTDHIAPSSDALLPEHEFVDLNVGEAKGVAKNPKVVAEDAEKADGRPRLSDSASTLDGKRISDNDASLAADVETKPGPPNRVSKKPLEFDDEEIPLKDDADTFIITRQEYPSERNGMLMNEFNAAVRAPVLTAARAGRAAKRMAEDVLAPRTLKRTFVNLKGTVTDGIVTYVNASTAGYDIPDIAGRVIEPIVNVKDWIPSQEDTDKFVDQATDKFQAMFGMRKRRWSMKTGTLDASGMARMEDAHRVFACDKGLEALQVLVDDGICHRWQIECERRILELRYPLQQALVSTPGVFRPVRSLPSCAGNFLPQAQTEHATRGAHGRKALLVCR